MIRLADSIFQRLREAGVRHVFRAQGGAAGVTPSLSVVTNLHERAGAVCAEGSARITGGPDCLTADRRQIFMPPGRLRKLGGLAALRSLFSQPTSMGLPPCSRTVAGLTTYTAA